MRVAIVAPNWGNSWIKLFSKLLTDVGHDPLHVSPEEPVQFPADAHLHMWARDNHFLAEEGQHIMFMRRYEFFDAEHWMALPWDRIDHLVLCNGWIKEQVDAFFEYNKIEQETHLIYNALDPQEWTFNNRSHGTKIGMCCHVHQKKNIPLALQILAELPPNYELHIAGGIQDRALVEYIANIGPVLQRHVKLYGQIPREELDNWWEDKSYCLSTSISEGNPNNVLEAMAKGVKPVVHAWPGAEEQFPVFYTVREAVADILTGEYISSDYRRVIEEYHSLENYRKAIDLIERR